MATIGFGKGQTGASLIGTKSLLKEIEEALDLVSDKDISRFINDTAISVAKSIRNNAPERTGVLKGSIHANRVKMRTMKKKFGFKHGIGSFIRADYNATRPKNIQGRGGGSSASSNFPYIIAQEFGTPWMAGKFFFTGTWSRTKGYWKKRIFRKIKSRIKENAKKAARKQAQKVKSKS